MKTTKQKARPTLKTAPRKKKNIFTRLGYAAFVAIAAFALYANTFNHGYVLDDYEAISGNSVVQAGVGSIPRIMSTGYRYGMSGQNEEIYRPLPLVLFALEWQIAPASPAFGHIINVMLYVLASVALFYFLKRIFSAYHLVVPFLITLLWTAHPMHTEVVANIKSVDEILAFLFTVIAMNQAVIYNAKGKWIHLVLIPLCFMLALMSKESAASLLLLAPACLFFFTGINRKRMLWISIMLVMVLGAYLAIRYSVLEQKMMKDLTVNDNVIAGAKNFSERYGTAFYLLGYYIYKLFVPVSFSCDYSYNQVPLTGFGNILTILSMAIYLFLLVYAVLRFKKKDPLAYGMLFYLISMATVSNILILIGSNMAERFLFMPSLGFAIVVVFVLFRLFGLKAMREPGHAIPLPKKAPLKILLLIFAIIFIFYSVKTTGRNPDWKSNLDLYSADIKSVPNSSKIKFMYSQQVIHDVLNGEIHPAEQAGYLDEAEKELKAGIAIDPSYSLLYNVLGQLYNLEKRYHEAIPAFKMSVALDSVNSRGYLNMGNSFFRLDQYDSAIIYIKKSIEIEPRGSNNYNSLASCYYAKGDYTQALQYYLKSASLNDNNSDTYYNLGAAYMKLNKPEDALKAFERALVLKPGATEIIESIDKVKSFIGQR